MVSRERIPTARTSAAREAHFSVLQTEGNKEACGVYGRDPVRPDKVTASGWCRNARKKTLREK